jgi:hypothetical protein
MASGGTELDQQIERLRKGDTLAENEVKALCEKVSKPMAVPAQAELRSSGLLPLGDHVRRVL